MSVIGFAIIMCDSSVRERECRWSESMTILTRRGPILRPGDLRGNSQGPPIAVQGGSFELALSCFAPASFELE